jgi:two-component system CheB/CheR fusion protein
MIDWVLQVAEMPARLLDYVTREKSLRLPPEDGPQPAQPVPPSADVDEAALRDVLLYLQARTGRDFSYYKRATIVRRIGRRMQVNAVPDLPAYLAFVRTHPGEAGALLHDLLISVTNFFRDREAFAVLEQNIGQVFANKQPTDAVRVWVPACATGEEAYSIAMLLLEHARTLEAPPSLQVFASDLDDEAIQQGRAGLYPETITADVSEERLRSFFIKDPRGYRVRRELREMVLFSVHDLLKDAPFSRMDLISCRNLLIYLNPEAKKRVFETFHFALRPQGLLFLGSSESVEDSPLFRVLDKKYRLFAHEHAVKRAFPLPSGPSTLQRTLEAQERASHAPAIHGRRFWQEPSFPFPSPLPAPDRASIAELHFQLIERLSPPSVLVNAEHSIVHVSENAGRFLRFSGGEPSADLLRLVHPVLRAEVRSALFRAAETKAPIQVANLPVELEGIPRLVDIRVLPASDIAAGYLLVIFEMRDRGPDDAAAPVSHTSAPPETIVRQLERELEQAKLQLRDTIEQGEASAEEMKASNEELQAINEELRSASEELETSREELQSINEELSTVNSEMKRKVDELAHTNADLQNLMASTAIPTVFLDGDLAITRYTPKANELFYLVPSDQGRPLAHIRHRVHYPEIIADIESVLRTLEPAEREVRNEERWFLARVQPYRTLEDHIGGVVLTFVDVTQRKLSDEALRASEEQFRRAIEEAPIPVIMHAEDGQVLQISRTWAELTGYSLEDIPTLDTWLRHADGSGADAVRGLLQAVFAGEAPRHQFDLQITTRAGERRDWVLTTAAPGRLGDGRRFAVGMVTDLTERMRAEQDLRHSEERLREADRRKNDFLAMLGHELRNPLAAIRGGIALLRSEKSQPATRARMLPIIADQVLHVERLLEDLLDVSRIVSGRVQLQRAHITVQKVLADAVEMVRGQIEAGGFDLQMRVAPEKLTVYGDAVRLSQIVVNVLGNAMKYSGEARRIDLSVWAQPGEACISIGDYGPGIAPDFLPFIFEPFMQAKPALTLDGGVGLGLAVVRQLVELHGGRVEAFSGGKRQGSEFVIHLPLARGSV